LKGVEVVRSFDELKKEWLKDEKFARVYDSKRPLRLFIRVIKSARLEMGLSQKDLAEAIGTSQSVIARIEAGKQNISYEMMNRLSDTLDLKLHIIATKEEVITLPTGLCEKLLTAGGLDESSDYSNVVRETLENSLEVREVLGRNPEFLKELSTKINQISDAYHIDAIDAIKYILTLGEATWEKLESEHVLDQPERCDEECLAG